MTDRVGLVPAAGLGERVAPLPCSKELFPVGLHREGGRVTPKVVSQYLLEGMRQAGVTRAYIVLRAGKWDIPAYFGDGARLDLSLAYLLMRSPGGPPYTSNQAYPFVRDALVAFGFPDIVFQPADAFSRLFDRQAATGADVVLGLFPAPDAYKQADAVQLDHIGRVLSVTPKPHTVLAPLTWILAVWTPAFSRYMHEYLSEPGGSESEISMGHVLRAALAGGVSFDQVTFEQGAYLDIGTPEDLVEAVRRAAQAAEGDG